MISAVTFLTIVGRGQAPDASTFRWFPIVGGGIGAVLAGVWWGASGLFPATVAALLVVVADLAITGMLHVDGLADSADGLLPHMDRGRRLEVMALPDIGAYGVAVTTVILLARWAALATDSFSAVTLIVVWALSRTVAAGAPAWLPYARADGLASSFLPGSSRLLAIVAAGLAVALGIVEGWVGLAAGASGLLATALLLLLAKRRIGGFTGDVLGASILITETVALVALTANP